jgi:hypothetical protein
VASWLAHDWPLKPIDLPVERPLNFFSDRRAWSPSTRRATSPPGSRLNQIENADRRKNDGPRKLTH